MNEEYQKGYVDPESFTQTYDEYIAKLSTGRVLGMVDQWWNFAYNVNDSLKQQGLDEKDAVMCRFRSLSMKELKISGTIQEEL